METKLIFNNLKGDQLVGILNKKSSRNIVILCHGFTTDKNSSKMVAIKNKLHDVSSFRFDFYAHGESEGNFENITVTEGVDDILCAIKYLKKLGYKNIGLIGSSFGGLCSIMAASKTNELSYLGLISPVSDWEDAKRKSSGEKYLLDWQKKGYTLHTKADGKKIKLGIALFKDFRNNIAYTVAEKIKIPTLIIHGTADKSVPIDQSLKLFKMLQGEKQFVKISVGDHKFTNKADFDHCINSVVDFIEDQLHGLRQQ